MSFIYFPQNSMTMLSNYEFLQNYQPQIRNLIGNYQQQYLQFIQWQNYFHLQGQMNDVKQSSITMLGTMDECNQSQIAIETKNNQEHQKKQKKILKKKNDKKQKQATSAKKNSQSNIINQYYSFFSSQQRSETLIKKAIQKTLPQTKFQQKILLLFYTTIKLINEKRGRKYVNRNLMLNYFTPDIFGENLPQIKDQVLNCDYVSIDELCQIFRRACHAFIKQVSLPAILTSKRIIGNSKQEHFKKGRIILKSLMGY